MICNKCQTPRSLSHFLVFKSGRLKGRRRTVCRSCRVQNQRKRRSKVKGGYSLFRRTRHLRRKWNLSLVEFDLMLESQNNQCAICKSPFTKILPPNVDHDHATNRLRGLLCIKCNTSLPLLENHIYSALEYLHKYGSFEDWNQL